MGGCACECVWVGARVCVGVCTRVYGCAWVWVGARASVSVCVCVCVRVYGCAPRRVSCHSASTVVQLPEY